MQAPGQGQGSLRTLSLYVQGCRLQELVGALWENSLALASQGAKLVILVKVQGGRAGSRGDVGLSIGMYLRCAGGLVTKSCPTLATPWK